MVEPRPLARLAGGLYLLLAALGGWAHLVVRGAVHVPGDPAATAAAIVESESLLRAALVADVLMATVFVLLGLVLFRLMHPERPRAATALLTLVVGGAVGILGNLTFHAGALLVATRPYLVEALGPQASEATALLMLELHRDGYVLGGVLFGLWLLPMGWFAYHSRLFPRALGVVVLIGAGFWLLDPVLALGAPDVSPWLREVVSAPTTVAELGLALYLLLVGVRRPRGAEVAAPRRARE